MEFNYNNEFFEEYEKRYMHKQRPSNSHSLKKKKPRRKKGGVQCIALIIAICIVVGILVFVPKNKADKTYSAHDDNTAARVTAAEPEPVVYYPKVTDSTVEFDAFVNSKHGVLVRLSDNTVIAERKADEKMYPASMTKLLTLITAMDYIDNLEDTYVMTEKIVNDAYLAGASVAGFSAGEKIKIIDLLYGTILPSGADATEGLADYIAGGEEQFAKLMNKKAQSLGLTTLNFTNSSGLHSENHYCTANDMAVILGEVIKNPTCKKIISTYKYTTGYTEKHPEGLPLVNTMFKYMYGDEPEGVNILAGKTGFTSQAGNCLASYAEDEQGNGYICVTSGAEGRYKMVFDHINIYSHYIGGKEITQ